MNEQKKTKPSPNYQALFDNLVDIVNDNGRPAYLIKRDNHLSIEPAIKLEEKVYLPPPDDHLVWTLPDAQTVIKHYESWSEQSSASLYDDLIEYHVRISELPHETYYELIAAWDLHTYLQEQIDYSPIISFYAVPERGKSRTGKGMLHVAYRGMHLTSLTEATIFRAAEQVNSAIFFDVSDLWRTALRKGCEDILLNRFEKGGRVGRVLNPEKGPFKDMRYFRIFGPTVIATNKPLSHILDTRAIHIDMPDTTARYEDPVRPENGLPLKERLVAFRARYMDAPLPDVVKPARGRLGDILHPLIQVARLTRPGREQELRNLICAIEHGRISDKSETPEGKTIAAILRLQTEVAGGILPVSRIREIYNEGKPERFQVSPNRIGQMLRALGFYSGPHRPRMSDGSAAIYWNQPFINNLATTHGITTSSDSSEMPTSPQQSPSNKETTDDTDDSDDPLKRPGE